MAGVFLIGANANWKRRGIYTPFFLLVSFTLLRIQETEGALSTKSYPNDRFETTRPIRVACVGDSITSYGCVSADNMTYVAQLSRMLGEDYEVTNFGDSGKTMLKTGICMHHDYEDCLSAFEANYTAPCSYWDTPTFRDALDSQPDVVTIMLGTNDAKECNWFSTPNGMPVGAGIQYRSAYLDMVSRFRSLPSNPRVFLAIPPPLVHPPGYPDQPPPFHMEAVVTNKILRGLIPNIAEESMLPNSRIIDVWSALGGIDGYEDDSMTCDGCHPKDEAAGIIAEAFASAITNDQTTINSVGRTTKSFRQEAQYN